MDRAMIPLLDRDDDDDLAAYTGQPPTPLAINTPPMMRGISPFAPRTPPPSPATSLDGYPRIWTPSPRLEALRRLSITTDATVPSMTRDASSDDVSVTWDTDTSTVHDVGLGINDEFEIEVHGIEYEDDCGVQHIEFIKDPVQLPEPSQGPLRPRPDMSRPFRRAPQPVHAMRPMASRQNSPRPRTRRSLGFRQSRSSSEPTSPRQTPSMQRRLSRRSPQSPASSFDSFLDMASDNEDNVFSRSAAFTVNLAKRISEEHRAHRLRRTAKNIMHTVLGGGRVRKTRVAFQCPGAGAPGLV